MILVNPLARDGFWQRWDFIGQLRERIEPDTNLLRRARLTRLRRRPQLLGQNPLNVILKLQAASPGLGSEFIRNLESNLHRRNVARSEPTGDPLGLNVIEQSPKLSLHPRGPRHLNLYSEVELSFMEIH